MEYRISGVDGTEWDREKLIDTMHQRSLALRSTELDWASLWSVHSVTIFGSYLLEKIRDFSVRKGSKER